MAVESSNPNYEARAAYSSQNLWSGFFFGLGIVAFVDETVFHQLLHWHHFYDKSTTDIGLVSDGLFHAFSFFATIAASFMFSDLRRRNALWPKRWFGGVLFGGGAFQLYDGTIQHKIMRLHQIRYHVDILPYDLVWNILAAIMVVIGLVLLRSTRRTPLETGGTATHER